MKALSSDGADTLLDFGVLLGTGSLVGVWCIEDLVQLFQSTTLGFNEDEEDEEGSECVLSDKPVVVLPSDVDLSDGGNEQVVETGNTDEETVKSHTLSTSFVLKTFDRVQSLHRGDGDGVSDTEEVDEGDNSVGHVLVGEGIGDWVSLGGESSNDGEVDSEHAFTVEHEGTTTESIDNGGTDESEDELDDSHQSREKTLGIWILDTGTLESERHEVGDNSVTGPLTNESHEEDHENTPEIAPAVEELTVIPPFLVRSIVGNTFLEFADLELDDRIVRVTLTMVLGENGESLIMTVIGEQPTWGFWEEEREDQDETRENTLEVKWDSPALIRVGEVETSSVGDPGSWDGTHEPESIVDTSNGTTPRWWSDFDDVGWTSGGRDVDTETEDETSDNELSPALGSSLNERTKDDKSSTDNHTPTTSPHVNHGADEWSSNDTTDIVDREEDTSLGTTTLWKTEVVQERLHRVDVTQNHTVVTVNARVEGSNQAEAVQLHRASRPWVLLGTSLSVGESDVLDIDFPSVNLFVLDDAAKLFVGAVAGGACFGHCCDS